MDNHSLHVQAPCQPDMESGLPPEAYSNVSIFDSYELTAFREQFLPIAFHADTILTPLYIVLGLFGDSISFFVWSRRKLYRNNSSAIYLAVVSLSDLFFLVFYLLQYLQRIWFMKVIDYPLWCPLFQVFFLTFQYLPISLTLTFTAERWFAISYPFLRDVWCTPRRACLISAIVAATTFILASVNFFFWAYKEEKKQCMPLPVSFKTAYSVFEQAVISAVLPICTLVMNLLVIKELRRITHSHNSVLRNRASKAAESSSSPVEKLHQTGGNPNRPTICVTESSLFTSTAEHQSLTTESSKFDDPYSFQRGASVNGNSTRRSSARLSVYSSGHKSPGEKVTPRSETSAFRSTTIMLLMVSFYLILCTLPAGAVLTIQALFPNGPECISEEYIYQHPKWSKFFIAQYIKESVDQFSVSHYAGNFIIYLATHASYRLEFLRLLTCGIVQPADRDEPNLPMRSRGRRQSNHHSQTFSATETHLLQPEGTTRGNLNLISSPNRMNRRSVR